MMSTSLPDKFPTIWYASKNSCNKSFGGNTEFIMVYGNGGGGGCRFGMKMVENPYGGRRDSESSFNFLRFSE